MEAKGGSSLKLEIIDKDNLNIDNHQEIYIENNVKQTTEKTELKTLEKIKQKANKIKRNIKHDLHTFRKLAGFLKSKENNLKRTFNLIKATINWKIYKAQKLDTYPISMVICPGNICNLHCKLCPVGLGDDGRDRGMMDFEIFKKIVDECGPYLYRIHLYNWGEPFLNKKIFEMIKYAKKQNIQIIISSNLNIFNDKIANGIIESGLDWLVVSLDGASAESVKIYQHGSDYDKVFKNMQHVVELREKAKKKLPLVEWRYVVNKFNENEIDKARKLANENKMRLGLIPIFPMTRDDYILKNDKQQFEEIKKWLPNNDSSLSAFDKKTKTKTSSVPSCTWPWFSSTINWNGAVTPCCLWSQKFDFGHLNKGTFKENWNNEKYQTARAVITNKKIDYSVICQTCKNNNNQANFF